MKLSDMPDIEFVDMDASTISDNIFAMYTKITGRTLAAADPVRLFLNTMVAIVIYLLNVINDTGKQNLLRYAINGNLDNIGALVNAYRIDASAATTMIKITLSDVLTTNSTIPAGTRVTPGDGIFFAIDNKTIIVAGETETTASATCTVKGNSGNDYAAGSINIIVDPLPFTATMINTTKSEGGDDGEPMDSGGAGDERFRQRIHEAPEKFSTAGPEGAYIYHTKTASSLICDVSVKSYDESPEKIYVRPLLEGGVIPGTEILNAVTAALNDKKVRPLTDRVYVKAPETVSFDVAVKYYVSQENKAYLTTIQTAVEAAVAKWVIWQKAKLGRDINPSQLTAMMITAGAFRVEVMSPLYTVVEDEKVAIAANVATTYGGIADE